MSYQAEPTPATEPQIAFIKSLAEQKDLGEHVEWMSNKLAEIDNDGITKSYASTLIGRLKALPSKRSPLGVDNPAAMIAKARENVGVGEPKDIVTAYAEQTLWEVPAGRYALVNDKADEQDTNPVLFYRVTIGKKAPWEGRRFVERIVGGDNDFKVKGPAATKVLHAIHADIIGAAQRYGREIGKCSHCNRTLTRRLSRELGMGHICAEKLGIDASVIADVKQSIIDAGHDPEETI